MKSYWGLFLVGLLLSACGGGGGGSTNNNNASSTGNNSSSLGNGQTDGNCSSEGVIFDGCFNPKWGVAQVWELNIQIGTAETYRTGSNLGNVQWKEVESPAAGHAKVLEVSYGKNANVLAHFNIFNEKPMNLADYGTGKLIFDLNVKNFGSIYDRDTGQGTFELIVECGWPCTSHSIFVPVTTLNQWKTVEVDIADLVNEGLDLSRVDSGLLIRPGIDNRPQTDIVFQLDNIRWVKGSSPVQATRDIYAEHFNTRESVNKWAFTTLGTSSMSWGVSLNQGFNIYPVWQTSFDRWAVETQLDQAIDIKNKTVKLQIKFDPTLVGTSGRISFNFSATDGNGRKLETESQNTLKLDSRQWYQIEFKLGSQFSGGFNPADVRKLSIQFDANGKDPSLTGYISIDTIRIIE